MRIVLATPLYPPDTEDPAPYVKELARHLASQHIITIVTYGRLPENVPGVQIVAVNKRRPLPLRLIAYTMALRRVARDADVLYAQNGPSTELPAGLVALVTRTPLVMHIGDPVAHEHAATHPLLRLIERFAFSRAQAVITDSPLPRPEILPLEPEPVAAQDAHRVSWEMHLRTLENTFTHA